MSSPARYASSSGNSVAAFFGARNISEASLKAASPVARAARGLTAFSFEFVAKPDQAATASLDLPAAIQSGLEDIAGFAGSLVMVSGLEARLITLIIFWSGAEAHRCCERIMRRVRALLAPYLDRCLRVQNLLAHLPARPELPQEGGSIDTCFLNEESVAEEANVCVA